MGTLADFIRDNGITMNAKSVGRNRHMDDSSMDHWYCTLRADGRRMSVYFSMGSGHKGKAPEADDVLDCLASDAAGVENARSFEEWCSEYGYDTDSRKALATYKACEKQAEKLRRLVGEKYEELLWETERL